MPTVPDRSWYDPLLDATLHTGADARRAVDALPDGADVAFDSETAGKNQFSVKCVTAAWHGTDGKVHAVLLDPVRRDDDGQRARQIVARAGRLILHNAPFDMPAMVHHGWAEADVCSRVVDTLVLARMAYPSTIVDKSLEGLAVRHLGLAEFKGGMTKAFKSNGWKIDDGWRLMDIDSPIYRQGALADTVATLRLEPIIRDHCRAWLTDHPFETYGATTAEQADELIATQERVHAIMLRRTVRGMAVDREYLFTYAEMVDRDRRLAEDLLAEHGLVGGRSKGGKIVEYLAEIGELPAGWPRTPKGAYKATKDLLADFDHPLTNAHRTITDYEMVTTWISEVDHQAEATGRCHPQCGTLGASATGRMSYGSPPLQQFGALARPIIRSDNPDAEANVEWLDAGLGGKRKSRPAGQGVQLWSIDWSQIEPVTMGCLAADEKFLAPYESGDDLYEPLMRAAGIDRDTAKVNLLATMYGRGIASLARALGTTEDKAAQIRRQILSAMPASARWMAKVSNHIAPTFNQVVTAAGRILPVDPNGTFRAVNYCLDPETPILTADLRHVPAYAVALGDQIIGFDEHVGPGKGQTRKLRTATVEATSEVVKQSVVVRAGDGSETVCSDDHLWLVRPKHRGHRQPNIVWRRADALMAGDELLFLGRWRTDTSRTAGYLAGLLDGEGWMTRPGSSRRSTQVVFSQLAGQVMDAYVKALAELNLAGRWRPRSETSTSPTDCVITSGVAECMRLVGTVRPERFLQRASDIYEGRAITAGLARSIEVVEVRPVGARLLTSIQTSTRTLVANGFLSHNCVQGSAYDVLAHTLVELDRQGLADHVMIGMHDELVIDADAETAAAVEQIMRTPPPFLTRWLGREPVLRTDRTAMGGSWQKV